MIIHYPSLLNSDVTGSVSITNDVTASIFTGSFVGDGSGLSNVLFDISEAASFAQPFTNQSSVTVNHNLNSQYPFVQVYESNTDEQIIPSVVRVLDSSSVQVEFSDVVSGNIVIAKAGHILQIQGTIQNSISLNGQPSSYYLDYTNFTNVPDGLVSGSSQLTASYDDRYTLSGSVSAADWDTLLNKPSNVFSGSFNDIPQNPFISASNTISASAHIVPTENETFDLGSPTQRWRDIYLSGSSIYLGNIILKDDNGQFVVKNEVGELIPFEGTATTASYVEFNNVANKPTLVSSSIQVVDILNSINSYTSSNDTTNTTQNSRLTQLETVSGSTIGRLNNIESFTSSINTTIKNELNSNTVISGSSQIVSILPTGVVSGSSQIDITGTTNYNQVVQTSTDQTIGGNKTFSNNVIVSGDLSVNGTVNYTNTCNFNVGDNIIELNYGGSATVGGIYVKDASGTLTSGSLLWNSSTDRWIVGQSGSESNVLLANSFDVVSGSSQIDAASTTNWTTNVKTRLNAETVISGSSQVDNYFMFAVSDETTNITSGTSKLTFRTPFAMNLYQIPRASLNSASTSGNVVVDINENGTSILGVNKLSIDANEKSSVTAQTPTTLSDTVLADDSEITVDIDSSGTNAKGLKVILYYRKA